MSRSVLRSGALLIAMALVVGGCAIGAPPLVSSAAQTVDGPFTLSFALPKSVWSASESIQGAASLVYSGQASLEIVHSNPTPFNFSYIELTGNRAMGDPLISNLVCAPRPLEPGQTLTSLLFKTGVYGPEEPNYEFYKSFFADPKTIRLPTGLWLVTAYAVFGEGDCGSGISHALQASVVVLVVA